MKKTSWTFSKLEAYETCPRRYKEYYITKSAVEGESEALLWGNKVHAAMAKAIEDRAPLPEDMKQWQHWVDTVKAGPGTLYVEQRYALDPTFNPTAWFGKDAWLRGIADVVRVDDDLGLALDWKTGKPKPNSVQLGIMALCVMQTFPEVQAVRTEFIWLNDETTTSINYYREKLPEFLSPLLERVDTFEKAHEDNNFPPKPGGLCTKWCAVRECEFHGKGSYR